uniref:Cytochrome c oxidase assembly factor 3 mitochondrial coiled-coil domain-containing protein n=1 Tax=Glossina brevipalpis TaxID=37001 RepID=A0A1A9WWY1_9MUSC
MQKKPLPANSLFDKFHRGAVYACIAVTLYGTFMLGMRGWSYYTVTRPERQKADLQMIEEGSSHDTAKELKY